VGKQWLKELAGEIGRVDSGSLDFIAQSERAKIAFRKLTAWSAHGRSAAHIFAGSPGCGGWSETRYPNSLLLNERLHPAAVPVVHVVAGCSGWIGQTKDRGKWAIGSGLSSGDAGRKRIFISSAIAAWREDAVAQATAAARARLCRSSGLRRRHRKNGTRRRAHWKDGARFPKRSLSGSLRSNGVGGWNKRHSRCTGIKDRWVGSLPAKRRRWLGIGGDMPKSLRRRIVAAAGIGIVLLPSDESVDRISTSAPRHRSAK